MARLKGQTAFLAAWVLGEAVLALPCQAQNYQPPPQAGGPPILMQQAPPDPRQFCYYNGQPYSMGSAYPANTPGASGRPMRCRATPAMVNGYIMMEWSDEN
ncbi:MAG TPA: hypothetical protein VL752_10305 [Acidisoma sp.]|uniref:hypothetical protein n=1 Tax=Acidisoma sp. TaxID=1872115 RepID=UPI002C8FE4E6|nr:hypothetical protein [Acidisoma sp.]HTI01323.1 hypothetical protein [Acidisoma sp.]